MGITDVDDKIIRRAAEVSAEGDAPGDRPPSCSTGVCCISVPPWLTSTRGSAGALWQVIRGVSALVKEACSILGSKAFDALVPCLSLVPALFPRPPGLPRTRKAKACFWLGKLSLRELQFSHLFSTLGSSLITHASFRGSFWGKVLTEGLS